MSDGPFCAPLPPDVAAAWAAYDKALTEPQPSGLTWLDEAKQAFADRQGIDVSQVLVRHVSGFEPWSRPVPQPVVGPTVTSNCHACHDTIDVPLDTCHRIHWCDDCNGC